MRRHSLSGFVVAFLFLSFFQDQAQAGLSQVSLGATYPTPLGYTYDSLDHSLGVSAGLVIDQSFFLANTAAIHFQANYEPFTVRGSTVGGQPAISLNTAQFYGGLIFSRKGPTPKSITPFIALDLGFAYNWIRFSNGASLVSNAGMAFAAQAVPGLDVPITDSLGVLFEIPTRVFFVTRTVVIWSPTFSLRLKL